MRVRIPPSAPSMLVHIQRQVNAADNLPVAIVELHQRFHQTSIDHLITAAASLPSPHGVPSGKLTLHLPFLRCL